MRVGTLKANLLNLPDSGEVIISVTNGNTTTYHTVKSVNIYNQPDQAILHIDTKDMA